jgi:hypothetical protein
MPDVRRASVADLVDSTLRIRRRRVAVHGLISVTAIIALATALAAVAVRAHPTVSPIVPRPVPSAVESTLLSNPGYPIGGRFVDRQHGFVMLLRCPAAQIGDGCRDYLETTVDGGATFHESVLPGTPGTTAVFATRLYVFDTVHLVFDQGHSQGGASQPPTTNQAPSRWISADAGATWTPVSTRSGSSLSVLPADSQLSNAAETMAAAQLTVDGVTHRLNSAGPAGVTFNSDVNTYTGKIGGSYFLDNVVESNPPSDTGLRVSVDDGRSWHAVNLPNDVTNPEIVGSDGRWIYAVADGGPGDGRRIAIISSDGGRNWQRVRLPDVPIAPTLGVSYAMSPDGGLLYADGSRVWRLRGDGKFEPVVEGAPTIFLLTLGPAVGALQTDTAGNVSLAVSTDGSHWHAGTRR